MIIISRFSTTSTWWKSISLYRSPIRANRFISFHFLSDLFLCNNLSWLDKWKSQQWWWFHLLSITILFWLMTYRKETRHQCVQLPTTCNWSYRNTTTHKHVVSDMLADDEDDDENDNSIIELVSILDHLVVISIRSSMIDTVYSDNVSDSEFPSIRYPFYLTPSLMNGSRLLLLHYVAVWKASVSSDLS